MSREDGPLEADTLRVLLSTDNHLGYAEKDPVRGNDSFRSFREILQLAQRERVDLLLLGGDLFHENKPSRRTLYETMRLLRAHCMGNGSVNFQVVSDQSVNFPNFGVVNFEDPNYNVELPIFSIHGNHDDPAREGGGNFTQSLAALDLLSAANLINYFGKSDKVDAVEVFPVLLTKGSTRVAIYGLGNMRDERLNRMFAQGKVVFRRPAEHAEEWFSIFVVHQNRDDKGRGSKNCVPESVIPNFIDLVVWGHEHESQIDVQESVKGDFFITQPGSSVATSLVEGEAKPKSVAVVEIHGRSFRMTTSELQTVRPFKISEVILSEIENLEPNDPDVAEHISEYLEGRVIELLHEAELERQDRAKERAKARDKRQHESPFPLPEDASGDNIKELVLIRLRVEHTGFPVIVNQRFGAMFVGKVANPNDILLFFRRKKHSINALDKKAVLELEKTLLGRPVRPPPLAAVTIEDILSNQLCMPERKLVLLPDAQLGIALEKFTRKNNSSAIQEFVDNVLHETQHELGSKSSAKSTQDILNVVGKKKEQTDALHALDRMENAEFSIEKRESMSGNNLPMNELDLRQDKSDKTPAKSSNRRSGTPKVSRTKMATSRRKVNRNSDLFDLVDDSDANSPSEQANLSKDVLIRSTRTKTAKTRNALGFDKEDFSDALAEDDGDEDFKLQDDSDDEEQSTPTSKVKPRKKLSTPLKKATKAASNRKRLRSASDYQHNEVSVGVPTWIEASRTSQGSIAFDLCSESEHEESAPTKRAKQTMTKSSQPHKFHSIFKRQHEKNDDDDIEEDRQFTQLTDERSEGNIWPSQSQSESLMTGTTTRRKLPLSMVTASQSQSREVSRKTASSAARQSWGRSRQQRKTS
ncbi:hypothetical protein CCR75_006698 [Bremia lactucae]|uniref:Mre11 DNA-binding domain-containing protein n=1 Tax=Bremia lactucae TaxID=4779 RepID=A0A976IM32_BRELC|nr:hypothetical protein CCR75_006698 [Bremia lactucae]